MPRSSRKESVTVSAVVEENKVFKTAIYVRLSREDERKIENESVESQLDFLRDYVSRDKSLEVIDEYVDRSFTGTRFDRPEFNRMISDVKSGMINCIVVKDLSRLGRNYLEAGDYIEKIFPFFGVRFIAATDAYDSLTSRASDDGLTVPLKNLINEAYAKDISRKVASVFENKFKEGIYTACMVPFGYERVEFDSSTIVVDKTARPTVERIFNEYSGGKSLVSIAKELNAEGIPSPTQHFIETGARKSLTNSDSRWMVKTLRQILQNPIYTGDVEMGRERRMMYKGIKVRKMDKDDRYYVKNHHEAIVCREIFEAAQRRLKETKDLYRQRNESLSEGKNNREALLKGVLYCGDCRHPMYMRRRTRKIKSGYGHYSYYACSRSGIYENDPKKYWNADKAESTIADMIRIHIALFTEAADRMRLINKRRATVEQRETFEKSIRDLNKRKSKINDVIHELYLNFADDVFSEEEYLEVKKSYMDELEEVERKLKKANNDLREYKQAFSGDSMMAEAFQQYEGFECLTADIVKTFIKRIFYYSNDRIEVEFTFQDQLQEFLELVKKREEAA